MGLFLRKKSSKASLKATKDERRLATPPPQLPPLPDHIRRAEEAAKAAAAANNDSMNARPNRRRSRSLWADSDEAKAAVGARSRIDTLGTSAGDLASQPWRSHEAWMAFQSPKTNQSVLDELIFPCSPSGAQPGWRGRGGGGLFSTEGMLDQHTIRRAATPTAPNSPSARRFQSPTPPTPNGPARKLDFGSPLADSSNDSERAVTPPEELPITPRARNDSFNTERPTPADTIGSSPGHTRPSPDAVLLTPNSTLLPSFNSRSPSPLPSSEAGRPPTSQSGNLAMMVNTPTRSPQRALPPTPPEGDEATSGQETEVIDFSRATEPNQSSSSSFETAPIMPRSSIPKRSSSSSRSRYGSQYGSTYGPPRSSPSPIPFASPPTSMSPLPTEGGFQAPMRLPLNPRRPSTTLGNTPSMLPYAQPAPSKPMPAPASSRQASRYDAPREAPRPPSRNTSSGSRGTHGTHSRRGSRSASSSGHQSGYHSDAASVPVPHTPEGIAQAVSIWRQKSQRREAEHAAIAAGMVPQQRQWENPDVFAPAGAWEASGSYNPYDAAEFEQPFTAPLRLPKSPAGVPAPHAVPAIVRRPSAGHAVHSHVGRSPRVQQQVAQPGWI